MGIANVFEMDDSLTSAGHSDAYSMYSCAYDAVESDNESCVDAPLDDAPEPSDDDCRAAAPAAVEERDLLLFTSSVSTFIDPYDDYGSTINARQAVLRLRCFFFFLCFLCLMCAARDSQPTGDGYDPPEAAECSGSDKK